MTDSNEMKRHLDRPGVQRGQHYSNTAQRRDFVGDLTDAVRDNPLPAALIGMGILWMFAGGSKTSLGDAVNTRNTGSMAGSLAKGASKLGKSMLHGAEALGSTVAGAAHQSAEAVSEAAGQIGNVLTRSSRHGSNPGDSMEYGWDDENEYSDRQNYAGFSLQSGLQQRLSELLDQRPLVLGAAGLALGAGIAASLPVSETERQAFGKASDGLRNKVSEAVDHAKGVAAAVVDEAEAQGISSPAVRDGLNSVIGRS